MQKYIHYGADTFERSAFKHVVNINYFNKPKGGLWASRVDDECGWKNWCECEEFRLERLEYAFTFTLKESANVVEIETSTDIVCKLPLCETLKSECPSCERYYIDFEDCIKRGIDAIEIIDIGEVYWSLYGWDVNCILILNPDIIVTEERRSANDN